MGKRENSLIQLATSHLRCSIAVLFKRLFKYSSNFLLHYSKDGYCKRTSKETMPAPTLIHCDTHFIWARQALLQCRQEAERPDLNKATSSLIILSEKPHLTAMDFKVHIPVTSCWTAPPSRLYCLKGLLLSQRNYVLLDFKACNRMTRLFNKERRGWSGKALMIVLTKLTRRCYCCKLLVLKCSKGKVVLEIGNSTGAGERFKGSQAFQLHSFLFQGCVKVCKRTRKLQSASCASSQFQSFKPRNKNVTLIL